MKWMRPPRRAFFLGNVPHFLGGSTARSEIPLHVAQNEEVCETEKQADCWCFHSPQCVSLETAF